MPRRLLLLASLFLSFAAHAQNGAITINPGSECQGIFKSVWLSIDGTMEAAVNGGSPNRADNVAPGTHEVTVSCFEGFNARTLLTQDVTFLPGTELRMRLKGKSLELVGKGPWAPPVVAVARATNQGPTAAMKKEAGSFLDDADTDLKDLLKLLQDEDDRCVVKVSAKLELAREALGGSVSLETVDDTRDRVEAAREASRKCGSSLGRDVTRGLDRVAKSLNRAAKVLQ
ncbi:MAG: hypothetical protein MUC96_03010 [Myxococcaceae bacterium]|jgi:hypothetical protein|nr:hypothetical protein [Myxococcaceae bacterium]